MNMRDHKGFVRREGKCSAEELVTSGLQLVKIQQAECSNSNFIETFPHAKMLDCIGNFT